MSDKAPPRLAGTEDVATGGVPRGLTAVTLEAIEGPGAGARHVLTAGSITVGAGSECEFRLNDGAVSRVHASMELLPGAVLVRDLKSRNGTFYLEARIEQARVPFGGSLRLGRTTLRLTPVQTAAAVSEKESLAGLIGRSLPMRAVFAQVEKLGASDSTVLLQGETGTGKEAVARAIHALSARRAQPFVVFDCASASAETIESELFGHARGAFTGAVSNREGIISTVRGGTLFLDAVSELSPALQPKLLRVLEAREYTPLGDRTPRKFEGRVLTSSQLKLDELVAAGKFRSDLMFRLAVTVVNVPPLRERVEDIPVLALHFGRELKQVDVKLSSTTLAAFQGERWPGNVRQLRNMVERVLSLGQQETEPSSAPVSEVDTSFEQARDRLLDAFERDYLLALIARHDNMTDAIRESKLSRTQFYRLLRRHKISPRGA